MNAIKTPEIKSLYVWIDEDGVLREVGPFTPEAKIVQILARQDALNEIVGKLTKAS